MGAHGVKLASLSILNELLAGGRKSLKPSGCWAETTTARHAGGSANKTEHLGDKDVEKERRLAGPSRRNKDVIEA